MNRVLIISDSHGWEKEMSNIRKHHQDVDDAIHCGDSELDEANPNLRDFRVVKGNCDWNGNFPEEIIFELGCLTFLITHGHLFDIKRSLMRLEYRAQEVNADIVCFGHSHVAYAENIGGRLFINPGSIRLPRHFKEGSYVLLSWEDPTDVTCEFLNKQGEKIEGFPYPNAFKLK